jgi:hypothetical protein
MDKDKRGWARRKGRSRERVGSERGWAVRGIRASWGKVCSGVAPEIRTRHG